MTYANGVRARLLSRSGTAPSASALRRCIGVGRPPAPLSEGARRVRYLLTVGNCGRNIPSSY